MRELTQAQREHLIEILVDSYVESLEDWEEYGYRDLFEYGFKGFLTYTDEELIIKFTEHFGENIDDELNNL